MNRSAIQSKIFLLLLMVCPFAPSQSQDTLTWIKEHQVILLRGCAVAGLLLVTQVVLPRLIKTYNVTQVDKARQNIQQDIAKRIAEKRSSLAEQSQNYTSTYNEAECDAIKDTFEQNKKALQSSWKNITQSGVSISRSLLYSGRVNISNATAFADFTLDGEGILTNCSSELITRFTGNVIANACQFNGQLSIENTAHFASFTDSLLGNIAVKGNNTLIELTNTIIDGDLVFESEGIVILDNASIITGTIIQGTIIRK